MRVTGCLNRPSCTVKAGMISRDIDVKENADVDSEDGVADFHFSSRLADVAWPAATLAALVSLMTQ